MQILELVGGIILLITTYTIANSKEKELERM